MVQLTVLLILFLVYVDSDFLVLNEDVELITLSLKKEPKKLELFQVYQVKENFTTGG